VVAKRDLRSVPIRLLEGRQERGKKGPVMGGGGWKWTAPESGWKHAASHGGSGYIQFQHMGILY